MPRFGQIGKSSRWKKCTARRTIKIDVFSGTKFAYSKTIKRGSNFYVNSTNDVILGWHGTYDPPTDMAGQSLIRRTARTARTARASRARSASTRPKKSRIRRTPGPHVRSKSKARKPKKTPYRCRTAPKRSNVYMRRIKLTPGWKL